MDIFSQYYKSLRNVGYQTNEPLFTSRLLYLNVCNVERINDKLHHRLE